MARFDVVVIQGFVEAALPRRAPPTFGRSAPPSRRSPSSVQKRSRKLTALITSAALSTGLLSTAATAAQLRRDHVPTWQPAAVPVLVEASASKPVDLRVGPHRFRIPRAYFRHPPHPSGVDDGFYVRARWPDMEPETEKTRPAFRASIRTEEGQRVLQVLLVQNQPHMPWPVARWMLQNSASVPGAAEADRADLEAFAPASPETFGLRALRPSGDRRDLGRQRLVPWGAGGRALRRRALRARP